MSTSGVNVCENGLVDDNFLVYTTIPCSLRLGVHVGLSIVWVSWSALLLLELLISRLLGHFSKFHAAKKSNGNVFVKDAAYLPLLVGGLVIFIIPICDPQASVQDRVGTGLWIAVSLSLLGLVALPTAVAIFNTQPLLTTAGVHSNTFKSADFNTRVFQIIKCVQYTACISFFVITFVTLIILPNTLVNFHDRQTAIDVCFVAFGIAFAISMASVTATSEAIIKVVDARIQFEKDLPAHNRDIPTPLSVARTRLRFLTMVALTSGLCFCVSCILIGANVIPLDWIVAHLIFGFLPASASLSYRLLMRDSFLDAYCCLAQSTSPHHSIKDRDASDHGPGGKVVAMEKVQTSSDYNMEPSSPSSPSELLAKLDLSSLKTPAHALLTMMKE